MIYLRQILKQPVYDQTGEQIGVISDLAIATGEVFPRVTSLAFVGPRKTPFMISWRKYVASYDGSSVHLNVPSSDIRFSYLQPNEVLLARDLLDKQIVDTQGMKVVRVNDLKLSDSIKGLRLLGAETGIRGLLWGIAPFLEKAVNGIATLFGHPLKERLIAWNYMELLERDMSQIKLSISHKRLHDMHPADIADIIEQLDPQQRQAVFDQLDTEAAADAVAELEDEFQADVIDDMPEGRGAELLNEMDPDDAADIIGDLPYDKAEKLLKLMGMEEEASVRALLGYKEETAGGIMTPDFVSVNDDLTVSDAVDAIRSMDEDQESIHYLYLVSPDGVLTGVLSLRELVISKPETPLDDISTRELITAPPEMDQEECAQMIAKYDLLALPVVDERGIMLGVVTVDDAMDVMEEEHEEDLQQRSITSPWVIGIVVCLLLIIGTLVFMLNS
jgi:magnesium transporter